MAPGSGNSGERRNVVISCGGKWVGMVLSVKSAMTELDALRGGKVIVADCAQVTAAGAFADSSVVVPRISAPGYAEALLERCLEQGAAVLLPLIDIDLNVLCDHKEMFASHGVHLVSPNRPLFDLCFDKLAFQEFADANGLPTPQHVAVTDLEQATYPLFARPIRGFGSIGARVVASSAEALAIVAEGEFIFHERVDAMEISVDSHLARDGRCTVRVPRVRDKVVGGEAYVSHTIRSEAADQLAQAMGQALAARGFYGPFNTQMFVDQGVAKLIEVNTRLGSASTFSNFAASGRLFRNTLGDGVGEVSVGEPEDYRDDVQLYRFIGDVYHDGQQAISGFPTYTSVT